MTDDPGPRTTLPDARVSPRYAGICTFGRYPTLDHASTPVDWALYGVPYDGGVSYRPGARFGPRAIREQSQYLKRYHLEHRIDVCHALSLADAGDAPVAPYHPRACLEAVAVFASSVGDPASTRLLALGGDHSVAYAAALATWRRLGSPHGGLAMIHIDSHLDTADSLWGERYSHASPFIRLIEEGAVDPAAMISIGIKGPLNTGDDLRYAERAGLTIVTHEDWRARDGAATIGRFARALGDRPVYISFDIDAVDPVFAPGTGTPCPGGFTSSQALTLVRSLAGVNVVGADVVEVLPDRDVAGNTALLAAHIAFEIIALDALRRSRRA